jgi:hypothetical protein
MLLIISLLATDTSSRFLVNALLTCVDEHSSASKKPEVIGEDLLLLDLFIWHMAGINRPPRYKRKLVNTVNPKTLENIPAV